MLKLLAYTLRAPIRRGFALDQTAVTRLPRVLATAPCCFGSWRPRLSQRGLRAGDERTWRIECRCLEHNQPSLRQQ